MSSVSAPRIHVPVTVLSAALSLGLCFATTSCSDAATQSGDSSSASNERVGAGSLDLQLANGQSVTSIGYTITGPKAFSKTGAFDVSHSSKISATIGGIPAGDG